MPGLGFSRKSNKPPFDFLESFRAFIPAPFFFAAPLVVDFCGESNKPPFASLQSFPGFHFPSGIIARPAASPDLAKNQPIGP
ncbi:MAG: hypothetical protein LBT97_04350 [Planctomycetota bacterium]|nr:hypothetical protein [Planctomycetota bacterium]